MKDKETSLSYIERWLRRYKDIKEALPFIQKIKELLEWESEALEDKPEEAEEIPLPDVESEDFRRLDFFKNTFPMSPKIDKYQFINSTAVTTGGSSDLFQYVARVGDLDTPEAIRYSEEFTTKYEAIQENQSRQDDVESLIKSLGNHRTLERFHRAKQAIAEVKTEIGNRTSAANELRNLIRGVKGDLFQHARKWDKENMTWELMGKRLSKGGEDSPSYIEILESEKRYRQLKERLSDVLKDLKKGSLTNLSYIWSEVLDHTYILLSLVRLEGKS